MKHPEVRNNAELVIHAPKLLAALSRLVADSLATDFNEHWDSYKDADRLVHKLCRADANTSAVPRHAIDGR